MLTATLLSLGLWAFGGEIPDGWTPAAPRDEIRPQFSFEERAWVIETNASAGQHGWFNKAFPISGGTWYRVRAQRRTENVAVPRRSAIVRVVWQDAQGKSVLADVPAGREAESGPVPLAEPEHPLDQATDAAGWTEVSGTYRAPTRATQAVVELHLQWAPHGRVALRDIQFAVTEPLPSRKVRLATVHYMPSGTSARDNCEEFAPFLAEAARQRADLVVLGETVPYVRLKQRPHETAEPIPGPSTDIFARFAREHGLHIAVGLYERDRDRVYNTAVLLGPDGTLLGRYRKVCLPHSEVEAGVTPGSEYPVFATKFGKVGLMVCYDGFFPEIARELTIRGAEVIAWPVWGCNPLLARARACENHVFVVSSTYTDAKSQWMQSAVYDHAGQAIARAETWGSVAVAEVDLSRPHFWRNNLGDFHAMAQRHRPPPVPELPPKPAANEKPAAGETPASASRPKNAGPRTVAVMLFDGVELMDFAGPTEVFVVAERGRAFRVVTVAASTKPLKTMGGVTVTPDFAFDAAPKADIVVVPGGNLGAVPAAGRTWLKKASGEAEITMSVCYGALLLAEAGLLDGVTATTHHWALDDLRSAAPKCRVVSGRRFVDSGRILTTAGVTAGIDGALHVVERLTGSAAANWTAEEWMEHERR